MKSCPSCTNIKDCSEFYFKKSLNSYASYCKVCSRARTRQWRLSNSEKKKQQDKDYAAKNQDKLKIIKDRWKENNSEKVKESNRKYYDSVKGTEKDPKSKWSRNNRLYSKNYFQNNKEKWRNRYNLRYHGEVEFKIASLIRSRFRLALKGNAKKGSAIVMLGCTIEHFKQYIASKFQEGMSWDNWGATGWHLDHIQPMCSVDVKNIEELKKVCHYTNFQPLWAKDNLSKGGKWKEQNVECY